jgi:transcriptional regulator GlxA family with amidase domain
MQRSSEVTEASADPREIAFVVYPGLTLLDLVGPLQALSLLPALGFPFATVTVGETLDAVDTDVPLRITPNRTFDEVPRPSVLVVPGGTAPTMRALSDDRLIEYVRTAARSADNVASVCTGSLILAAAGILEDLDATTHWSCAPQLERLGARYLPERWVERGNVIASAGVSAGIDMALRLAARLAGEAAARQIQLILEYDPKPPFGPIEWDGVDRHAMDPVVDGWIREALAGRPDLIATLSGERADASART